MKKIIITLATLFLMQISYATTSSDYEKVMEAKIVTLQQAASLSDFQTAANAFERIAQKENKEWLPLYYAAYSYIRMGFFSTLTVEEKDTYLNKALVLISDAEVIEAHNSEITALKGYALMGKLTADAANRGQSLSPQVMQIYGKAIQQNPKNPRALFLLAQMEYGMAQFLGSGTEKACAMAKQSLMLYKQTTATGIQPSWGANGAKEMATRCQ